MYKKGKKMKTYKDFEKCYIGESDIAGLTIIGMTSLGIKTDFLNFGSDGSYLAYICNVYALNGIEIPKHYEKVALFWNWLKIYDDTGLTAEYEADKIEIYRAGNFGCIIKLTNFEK